MKIPHIVVTCFFLEWSEACQNGYLGPGSVTLNRSSSGTLCKLVKEMADGNMIPVARSYDGLDWEAAAGSYKTLTFTCTVSLCTTTLPSIGNDENYNILESSRSLTKKNEVARFLEQTTFGVTREDLNAFDYSIETDVSFANWINQQIHDVNPTSHREWFRRRANHRYPKPLPAVRTFHACEKSTRYRKFAFSALDRGKTLKIKKVGSKYALSIDGQFRTIVNTFDWDDWYVEEYGHFNSAEYEVTMDYVEDCLYCWTSVYDRINDEWVSIKCSAGTWDRCNPPIKFDPSIGTKIVQLPSDKIKFTTLKYYWTSATDQELVLTKDLDDSMCEDIKESYWTVPVFGYVQSLNKYFMHDPSPRLLSNDLDEPLMDGGSHSRSYSASRTQCSNAPRNFLNSDTCKLSDDIKACTFSGEPAIEITLDDESIKMFYDLSLEGDSTRYVYVVDGLRIESDSSTHSPCDSNASTRWLWVSKGKSCASNNLRAETKEYLSRIISWYDDGNPLLRDVRAWDHECHANDVNKKGFEIKVDDVCWRHVHQDHLSVFDMTYWTQDNTHPGNSPARNPIKEFAEAGKSTLYFPSWHTMDRWTLNKGYFNEIGRYGDRISFSDLPTKLKTDAVAMAFGGSSAINVGVGVVVCGSPNEISNDPSSGGGDGYGGFDFQSDSSETTGYYLKEQRKTVWSTIALQADDQLRQRMAWALSQILAVSAPSIENQLHTEPWLSFYDIFVRNAFGNYINILKEISYSYFMAESLTYYESASTALYWYWYNKVTYPDENYAREIMQLFSVGLCKLNLDGTLFSDDNGHMRNAVEDECHPTYSNDDIEEYARVWTGFIRNKPRGNIESEDGENNIDPMTIKTEYRDRFPKMGLNGVYIGDKYPLCSDSPKQRFLKKGARYVLLGSSSNSEHLDSPSEWSKDPDALILALGCDDISSRRMLRNGPKKNNLKKKKKPKKPKKKKKTKKPTSRPTSRPTSKPTSRPTRPVAGESCLYTQLCNPDSNGSCVFESEVELKMDAQCQNNECDVDTVTVVEVEPGMFYEYVEGPCVNQAFYPNARKITRGGWDNMCADPRSNKVATAACCEDGDWDWIEATRSEEYWGELMTYETAANRCNQINKPLCDAPSVWWDCTENEEYINECKHEPFLWTSDDCVQKIKIDPVNGKIAIVHDTGDSDYNSHRTSHIKEDSLTYFRVHWESNFPTPGNNCGGSNMCSIYEDMCLCEISVNDIRVFSSMPTKEDTLKELHIGSFDPLLLGLNNKQTTNGVTVYYKNEQGMYTINSVFEVMDYTGSIQYLRNIKSTVSVKGTSIIFRNPPHFMNLDTPKLRDAEYETDSALDHYFKHDNTAPFLAKQLIQRFGISNPSPNYIREVATSFRTGIFSASGFTFGSNKYGDLASTLAALLLHSEARSVVLDMDSSHGSLKEPLLKIIGFMRSMEYKAIDNSPFVEFHGDMVNKIGQMPYEIPSVFSFFLPNYQPAGPVSTAGLVSPETQLLTTPYTISSLNGLFSLIKYGFSYVWGGLSLNRWSRLEQPDLLPGNYEYALGRLSFTPTSSNTNNIVQELSTLLTSDRLSSSSKEIIKSVYNNEDNKEMALKMILQLMVTTPEFQSTGLVDKTGGTRPEYVSPDPSNKARKSLVFLILEGGVDSFNMLLAECEPLKSQYMAKRAELALSQGETIPITNLENNQPCKEFSLHHKLKFLQKSFNEGNTLFIANAGVLNTPVDRNNYWELTRTELFGHNTMQLEAQRVDPYQANPGTGVLGRLLNVLSGLDGNSGGPYQVSAISIDQSTTVLRGEKTPIIVSASGIDKFDPLPWSDTEEFANTELFPFMQALNEEHSISSNIFGETWSSSFLRGIQENELLEESANVDLTETFDDNYFSRSLEQLAKIIKSEGARGVDRSVYFVDHCCYDHHSNLKGDLDQKFEELDGGLDTFWKEMKAQGNKDNVIIVAVSDFARTLTPNSSQGSDHAWGGNYFMIGGKVKGKRIVGEFIDDFDGPLNIDSPEGRGRLIPSTSWDAIWNGVCQHMGIENEADLDYIIPNRHDCGSALFEKEDLFETD